MKLKMVPPPSHSTLQKALMNVQTRKLTIMPKKIVMNNPVFSALGPNRVSKTWVWMIFRMRDLKETALNLRLIKIMEDHKLVSKKKKVVSSHLMERRRWI